MWAQQTSVKLSMEAATALGLLLARGAGVPFPPPMWRGGFGFEAVLVALEGARDAGACEVAEEAAGVGVDVGVLAPREESPSLSSSS